MKKCFKYYRLAYVNLIIIFLFLCIAVCGNRVISVMSELRAPLRKCVIIDAGHGGVDGGAVSCTGVYESKINLEIALRLEDLLHLLGRNTMMIRDTDRSVYTEGTTIAAKKVSDIKERVRIANTTPEAVYISIHQNHFQDPRYSGMQVFHTSSSESKLLAQMLQSSAIQNLDPTNKRQCKQSSGVYLMEHINCTGVLIECGFLSHPQEEAKLRNCQYQKKLSCVIAATISQYLNT